MIIDHWAICLELHSDPEFVAVYVGPRWCKKDHTVHQGCLYQYQPLDQVSKIPKSLKEPQAVLKLHEVGSQ